ncbi:5-formyltetrahydrofolate cyclo-ligase [Acidithiobacillus sp.]|uniref:5-formyltetrahydrofolate cyclo-ligase n=1 Tax=Acidithiobacillus sp. TaxID=1872118 RepID=UPI0031FE4615
MRRRIRQQRRALSSEVLHYAAMALASHLVRLNHFRRARHIGLYWPMQGEISPLLLMQHSIAVNKHFYLPVLAGHFARSLRFAPFHPHMNLRSNRLHIPEPQVPPGYQRSVRELDLLILPLVAFDAEGYRLGMGGGFYDRSLAHLPHRRSWRRPRLIGVGHAFQEVPRLPREPWDIPLGIVCTEKGCYRIGS